MENKKVITYKGRKYWISGNGKYFYNDKYNGNGKKGRKKIALHRKIYEDNFGEIPEGYIVHHKNGDTFNNKPSNLESKPRGKHQSEHVKEWFKDPEYRKKNRKSLKKAQQKARTWHKSKKGREWHKDHYDESLGMAKKHEHTCVICGKKYYSTRIKKTKYCSDKCRNKRHSYYKKKNNKEKSICV
ncbi:MAG: HNH endonuclease signature motif containing protein [Petrotogales bacterium]